MSWSSDDSTVKTIGLIIGLVIPFVICGLCGIWWWMQVDEEVTGTMIKNGDDYGLKQYEEKKERVFQQIPVHNYSH